MKFFRFILLTMLMIVLAAASILSGFAAANYNSSLPNSCKITCFDSNSQGAFACGFDAENVYSQKLMPDCFIQYVGVKGSIRAVMQNGKYTCALICKDVGSDYYVLLELDTGSGKCKYHDVKNEHDVFAKYFSVSDGCLFLIKTDALHAYVKCISLSGRKTRTYKFSDNVTQLFNNNGKTYAVLYGGSVYRLSYSDCSLSTTVSENSKITNAGINHISDGKNVVSLADGKQSRIGGTDENCISVSGQSIYYTVSDVLYCQSGSSIKSCLIASSAKAVLTYGKNCAVLSFDNDFTVFSSGDFKSSSNSDNPQAADFNSGYIINSDGVICNIPSKMTVSQFKNMFSFAVTVYDENGNAVTSGKLGTGFSAKFNGNTYPIAVRGDVTGEGNIKSNDVSCLMEYFCSMTNFSKVFETAADYNLDGKTDNRDLVLISRNTQK